MHEIRRFILRPLRLRSSYELDQEELCRTLLMREDLQIPLNLEVECSRTDCYSSNVVIYIVL